MSARRPTSRAWVVLVAAVALAPVPAAAGPPFVTDDPEPVEHRHWEFYVASEDQVGRDGAAGTCPHVEVNYGAVPNLQLHLIAPVGWARPTGGPTAFGPGDVELGAKLRVIQEGGAVPMVGIFPQLELPAGSAAKGLGTGRLHAFFPIWLQKRRGPWTTYGGGGWWRNPGTGNRNYWLAGWLLQRQVRERVALGAEVYATTPDVVGGRGGTWLDAGSVVDLSARHHVLVSVGHSLAGASVFQAYAAWQLTI